MSRCKRPVWIAYLLNLFDKAKRLRNQPYCLLLEYESATYQIQIKSKNGRFARRHDHKNRKKKNFEIPKKKFNVFVLLIFVGK